MLSFPLSATLTTLAAALAAAAPGVRTEEVSFPSGKITIAATLILPDATGPVPAVVLVHGSGASDRSNPWTSAYADALAQRGIAVLHPDKRGSGKSGGDWKRASFEVLADDVARAVAYLRARKEVDAGNVGLVGFSQGVDVAPVCAARPEGADFVIAVSGSVVPLLDQVLFEIESGAARAGKPLSPAEIGSVRAIHVQALEYARSRKGWKELQDARADAMAASPAVGAALAGLPVESDHWMWDFLAAVGDFDPMPHWKRVTVPMLFVYGGRDTQVDGAASVARLRAEFAGTERNWSAIELAPNGHALFRDDVLDFAVRWIRDHGAP